MGIFRRREAEDTKESALAEARKAAASLRRGKARADRRRAGRQDDPAHDTTGGPWVEGGD